MAEAEPDTVSQRAIAQAMNTERIELAPEPVYTDATWVSNYRIDPFGLPASDKIAVDDFIKVDLRVGLVKFAERVKNSDKLKNQGQQQNPQDLQHMDNSKK